MRAVSLYSGAGGLDLGFEQAGSEVVFACERDRHAAASWRANRPAHAGAMHEGDIGDLWAAMLSEGRAADAVIGGPPCQSFSVAGKMDPKDPRGTHVLRFLEAVAQIRPALFVMENVAALARLARWHPVRVEIRGRLEELGYSFVWPTLNAQDFGVSQRRERAFLIGMRDKDTASVTARLGDARACPQSVRRLLNGLPEYGSEGNPADCQARVTLCKRPVMRASCYSGMLCNGGGRPIDADSLSPTLPASMGGNRTPIVDQRNLMDPACENWFVGYHRSLTQGASPADAAVPDHIRRLTLTEAKAIQGFPETYILTGPMSARYRQVGNAVPPRLAYAVAKAAMEVARV